MSQIERRACVRYMMSAAVLGSLIVGPNQAHAHVQSISPYSEVISHARDLVVLGEQYRVEGGLRLRVRINHQTDKLLGMMLDVFPGDVPVEQVVWVFKMKDFTIMRGERDRSIVDGVVPVAILRELTYKHHLPFQTKHMVNWDRFLGRYGDVLRRA